MRGCATFCSLLRLSAAQSLRAKLFYKAVCRALTCSLKGLWQLSETVKLCRTYVVARKMLLLVVLVPRGADQYVQVALQIVIERHFINVTTKKRPWLDVSQFLLEIDKEPSEATGYQSLCCCQDRNTHCKHGDLIWERYVGTQVNTYLDVPA